MLKFVGKTDELYEVFDTDTLKSKYLTEHDLISLFEEKDRHIVGVSKHGSTYQFYKTDKLSPEAYAAKMCVLYPSVDVIVFDKNDDKGTARKKVNYSHSDYCIVINNSDIKDFSGLFYRCSIKYLDLSHFDTHNVESMYSMFSEYMGKYIELRTLDTSNVVNMAYMFEKSMLYSLNLSSFDTSRVKNMTGMFSYYSLSDIDVSGFDTSDVMTMAFMFYNCQSKIIGLDKLNTSRVTDMTGMFEAYSGSSDIDVGSFDMSRVSYIKEMFMSCEAKILGIEKLCTSSIMSAYGAFQGISQERLDLSNFSTSNMRIMQLMLAYSCIEELNLSGLVLPENCNCASIFQNLRCKTLMLNKDQSDILDMFSCQTCNDMNVVYT